MLDIDILKKEAENAIKWIEEYTRNAGAKGVIIGNSGGKDSATVIAMATKALGKDKVLSVAMPCGSIEDDMNDAELVSNTFGVKLLKIDLTSSFDEMKENIENVIKCINMTELSKEAKINMKPRIRMTTLYSIAQTLGYLVLGTGNLCEIMVGYTTKWGDSGVDFNPLGNFTVEEVLAIGKLLGVPEKILKKAPNDGLRPDKQMKKKWELNILRLQR